MENLINNENDVIEIFQPESEYPSSNECLERCINFSSITETDRAVAMIFLQENNWNLEVC
jgi:hypothetical protein